MAAVSRCGHFQVEATLDSTDFDQWNSFVKTVLECRNILV